MITPFGRKVTRAEKEREEEERKTPLIVDTLFRDSARKPLGPIKALKGFFPGFLLNNICFTSNQIYIRKRET